LQPLIPTELQEKRIQEILSESTKAALIASEMGVGKTLIAVEVIKRLNPEKPVLIVGPLSTKISWERTFKRQNTPIEVFQIDSTKEGKAAYEAILEGKKGIYIIGHTLFRMREWRKTKLSVMVYDEIHDISNRKSKGFAVLKTVKTEWKIGMSGTPAGNRFQGMWSVTRWLWPQEIDRSFWRWAAEYAKVEFDPYAGKRVEGEREDGKFVASLPLYVRDKLTMDTDFIEEVRYVSLTPTQRDLYTQMEDDMLAWLREGVHVANVAMTQRARLRQITLGEPHINGTKWVVRKNKKGTQRVEIDNIDFDLDCKSSKIDALKEILANKPDEPFLVLLGDSAKFAKVVAHRLGESARVWTGEAGADLRKKLSTDFGLEYRILVATAASFGTGTDGFQERSNHMVWLSESDNNLTNQQAAARLYRTGQENHVYSWKIQAEKTLDEGIYNNLELQKLAMARSLT
jgi:SNF2 family DNA or RNA helicase